ncbi:hypothetical protein I302_104190 [Kwoniella bestiolae CBS 10118]|uniref:Uncharacterized protein n=1 Tax=Kwoniella bestiolae CBS 10118 TaxID=1296100 RepID=A0A1B9GAK1_9TREE|nr:hypothetical protein I302_02898 [Kwoniella bestiolae CBS 10118]OCF28047.1 hypothetical protein I302_02898 [Kwoniella bestiolae CBS 10118]
MTTEEPSVTVRELNNASSEASTPIPTPSVGLTQNAQGRTPQDEGESEAESWSGSQSAGQQTAICNISDQGPLDDSRGHDRPFTMDETVYKRFLYTFTAAQQAQRSIPSSRSISRNPCDIRMPFAQEESVSPTTISDSSKAGHVVICRQTLETRQSGRSSGTGITSDDTEEYFLSTRHPPTTIRENAPREDMVDGSGSENVISEMSDSQDDRE